MDSSQFWLPPGAKWCRLNRGDSIYLTITPWIALGLLLLRSLVENWVVEPLGQALSIPDRCCTAPQIHPRLEKVFKKTRGPSKEMIASLAKDIGWTQYRVQRWFWRSRNHKKPSLLTKFKETVWRFSAYFCLVGYGFWCNFHEPCLWDQSLCYYGYPTAAPSPTVLVYWACQLGLYCSFLVSQFKDIRRKDFYQMILHHITTVALLIFAYTVNLMQIGVLIAIVHDVSDVPLELAKLLHYASYDRLAHAAFCVFAVVFVVTRLVIFPFWLIWSVYFDISSLLGTFPALYMFTAFLLVLQLLHIYWFILIMNMVLELARHKELSGDTRSDSELSECTASTTDYYSNGLMNDKKSL